MMKSTQSFCSSSSSPLPCLAFLCPAQQQQQ